jgi:hypothetical protein
MLHGKAELPGVPDETGAPQVGNTVGPVPFLCAGRRRQPALGLVLADGGRLQPGQPRQLADRQPRHGASSVGATLMAYGPSVAPYRFRASLAALRGG